MQLMPLDDSRWVNYHGGYNRALYDVVPLIHRLNSEGRPRAFGKSFGMRFTIRVMLARLHMLLFNISWTTSRLSVKSMRSFFISASWLIWLSRRMAIRRFHRQSSFPT